MAGAGAHGSLEAVIEQVESVLGAAAVEDRLEEASDCAQVAGGLGFLISYYETLPEEALDMPALERLEATWEGTLTGLLESIWLTSL